MKGQVQVIVDRMTHLAGMGEGGEVGSAGGESEGGPHVLPQQLQQSSVAAERGSANVQRHIHQLQPEYVQVCKF